MTDPKNSPALDALLVGAFAAREKFVHSRELRSFYADKVKTYEALVTASKKAHDAIYKAVLAQCRQELVLIPDYTNGGEWWRLETPPKKGEPETAKAPVDFDPAQPESETTTITLVGTIKPGETLTQERVASMLANAGIEVESMRANTGAQEGQAEASVPPGVRRLTVSLSATVDLPDDRVSVGYINNAIECAIHEGMLDGLHHDPKTYSVIGGTLDGIGKSDEAPLPVTVSYTASNAYGPGVHAETIQPEAAFEDTQPVDLDMQAVAAEAVNGMTMEGYREPGKTVVRDAVAWEAAQRTVESIDPLDPRNYSTAGEVKLVGTFQFDSKTVEATAILPGTEVEKPKPIPPTVGRKVWLYIDRKRERLTEHRDVKIYDDQPLDASIAYLHPRRESWTRDYVTVSFADHAGKLHRAMVPVRQPGTDKPEARAWVEWMPFQRQEAAKK